MESEPLMLTLKSETETPVGKRTKRLYGAFSMTGFSETTSIELDTNTDL